MPLVSLHDSCLGNLNTKYYSLTRAYKFVISGGVTGLSGGNLAGLTRRRCVG